MGYYVNVDTAKKVLTIDDSITPNARDQFLIDNYLKVGYTIRFKSEKRAEKARERAKTKASVEEIKKAVEPYEDLKKICEFKSTGKGKGHGAFAVKSWYENEAKAEIEKRQKEAKEAK